MCEACWHATILVQYIVGGRTETQSYYLLIVEDGSYLLPVDYNIIAIAICNGCFCHTVTDTLSHVVTTV